MPQTTLPHALVYVTSLLDVLPFALKEPITELPTIDVLVGHHQLACAIVEALTKLTLVDRILFHL